MLLLCVSVPLVRCAIAQGSALQTAWQAIPHEGQIGHAQQAFHGHSMQMCNRLDYPTDGRFHEQVRHLVDKGSEEEGSDIH